MSWSTTGVRTLCILFDARVLTLNCFRSISIEGNGAGTVTLKRELSAMSILDFLYVSACAVILSCVFISVTLRYVNLY